MSTNNSSSTRDDASSSGDEADTKLIIRAMFGAAAALTLFTGAFFAHVWIYRVRRGREREEGAHASGGGEGGRTRTSFFGRTNGFISDVWTYVQKVRLANTLHRRFRDATEADLKGSGEEDGRSDFCAICLGKMVASPATIDALKPQVLLCGHVYHRTCLRSWLDKESFSCPICRASVWTGKEQKIEAQIEMNSSSNREGGGENSRGEEGENASGDGSSGERERENPPRRAFGGRRNDYRSIAANILSG